MNDSEFIICVYYYSLPEFPADCRIVRDNSLFVRDVLVCNPINFHVVLGGQYDPHYEHYLAPQYRMCMDRVRRKIMSIASNGTFDKVYLLFRTSKASQFRGHTQHVIGYYDVDLSNVVLDPDYEEPIIYAKKAILVRAQDAVDISKFLKLSSNYGLPFDSETQKGIFKKDLSSWKEKISSSQDCLKDYVDVTKQLDRLFKRNEFEEGVYAECADCPSQSECFLVKRINKKGKLYHQLPDDIAQRINRFYKSQNHI